MPVLHTGSQDFSYRFKLWPPPVVTGLTTYPLVAGLFPEAPLTILLLVAPSPPKWTNVA